MISILNRNQQLKIITPDTEILIIVMLSQESKPYTNIQVSPIGELSAFAYGQLDNENKEMTCIMISDYKNLFEIKETE